MKFVFPHIRSRQGSKLTRSELTRGELTRGELTRREVFGDGNGGIGIGNSVEIAGRASKMNFEIIEEVLGTAFNFFFLLNL